MLHADRIDSLLRDAVSDGRVPGVVALAARAGGEVLYEGAFGLRDTGTSEAMTHGTVMMIASMTKAITTLAALQLVERGRLSLQEPVGGIVAELSQPSVLEGFDPDGAPRLRPATQPITLHHLLTHTSGLGYEFWNADLRRYVQVTGLPSIGSGLDASLRLPLVFDPGARWEYGIGIDWAGKIVEAVSGERLDSYLRANVFEPLGMSDTTFSPKGKLANRLAVIHARGTDGGLTPLPPAPLDRQPEFLSGGGGLYSTARDYMRFLQMVLDQGAAGSLRLLGEDLVADMGRNQIGELEVTPMRSAAPEISHDVEFLPGLPKKWTYGFLRNEAPAPSGRRAGGLQWAGIANTYYWLDPGAGIAGLLLTQVLPFADPAVLDLLAAFETAVYGAPADGG